MTHSDAERATVADPESSCFVSPQELADIVQLHPAVIRRAIARGELRAYKLCSKIRIRRDDVTDWLERSAVPTYEP